MTPIKRAVVATALAVSTGCLFGETAQAACNATVNGRPMSPQLCAATIQVYGQVIPGNYLADEQGNWVNINNPQHRGNIYQDARSRRDRGSSSGGSWSGPSIISPSGVYDASGGCEGGSCVNIID